MVAVEGNFDQQIVVAGDPLVECSSGSAQKMWGSVWPGLAWGSVDAETENPAGV